jgi:hypothetical protein
MLKIVLPILLALLMTGQAAYAMNGSASSAAAGGMNGAASASASSSAMSTPNKGCNFHPNSDRCAPDNNSNCPSGFAHNDKGNCHPSGKCPSGFSRHTDDESGKCFSNRSHGHNHSNTKTIVIHKTVRHNEIAGVATVFVPGLGLVQPFNCKLNQINNKIGCEYLIVNPIN